MKQGDTVLAIRNQYNEDGTISHIWEQATIIGTWSENLIGYDPDSGFTVQFKDGHTVQHSSKYPSIKPLNPEDDTETDRSIK